MLVDLVCRVGQFATGTHSVSRQRLCWRDKLAYCVRKYYCQGPESAPTILRLIALVSVLKSVTQLNGLPVWKILELAVELNSKCGWHGWIFSPTKLSRQHFLVQSPADNVLQDRPRESLGWLAILGAGMNAEKLTLELLVCCLGRP